MRWALLLLFASACEGELPPFPHASNDGRTCDAAETCNEIDDDCDGRVDEGFSLDSDPRHCGGCAVSCTARLDNASASCVAGRCVLGPCEPGWASCDGRPENGCETSLESPDACGDCDRICPVPSHASERSCVSGQCGFTCAPGFDDCDGNRNNGCEAPLTSPANCGECGHRCERPSGASAVLCDLGECAFECTYGTGDCDGDADNGCEVELSSDPAHCGACLRECPVPALAARATCEQGECGFECGAGTANCDGNAVNGCEPLRTSENCAACGTPCALDNGFESCAAGACQLIGCEPPFDDCNAFADDGCEANITGDLEHCGGCGRACPIVDNATRTCSEGECSYACQGQYADCDGEGDNGCEADLVKGTTTGSTVVEHCGECGVACASGDVCCKREGGGRMCTPDAECSSCDRCGIAPKKSPPGPLFGLTLVALIFATVMRRRLRAGGASRATPRAKP